MKYTGTEYRSVNKEFKRAQRIMRNSSGGGIIGPNGFFKRRL